MTRFLFIGLVSCIAFSANAGTFQFRQIATGVQRAAPSIPLGDGASKVGACAEGTATACARWQNETSYNNGISAISSADAYALFRTPICRTSGKYYYEIMANPSMGPTIGVIASGVSATYGVPGFAYNNMGASVYLGTNLVDYTQGSTIVRQSALSPWQHGQWIGVALDLDSGSVTFLDSTKQFPLAQKLASGTCFSPAAGYAHGQTVSLNSGSAAFQYAVPAGYRRGFW